MQYGAATVDLDECIERLYKKELLADSVIEAICAKTKELLMKESNVVHIAAPVTVVGDIHGQFFDMIEIFKIGGFCPDTNYLFLGIPPYIEPALWPQTDRGNRRLRRSWSLQRGNHFAACLFETPLSPPCPPHPRQP